MKKTFLAVNLFFISCFISWSQQHESHVEEHEVIKGSHRVTIGIGHAHVFDGEIIDKNQWTILPSWTFNYDYWLSDKFALGLHNDLILESFIIEGKEGKLLDRNYPVAVVPVFLYRVANHFAIIGGAGAEFASTENLGLTRIGIESGWHLPKNWELGAEIVWDRKWDYYDSWGFSLTVSKIYRKKQ